MVRDTTNIKPPLNLEAWDTPSDGGGSISLSWTIPADTTGIEGYQIFRRAEGESLHQVGYAPADKSEYEDMLSVENYIKYTYKIRSVSHDDRVSYFSAPSSSVEAYPQWFRMNMLNVFVIIIIYFILVVYFVRIARKGKKIFLRKIPGLNSLDEAVGRATEMGKPVLFVPGIGYMEEIATIAAMNILKPVSKRVAQYSTRIIVPAIDPIVMNVAQQTVKEGFAEAGRPDLYDEDDIFFLAYSQFAYAAGTNGIMMREEPATNLFLGVFYAESLLLAETGNATGAIQIAGSDKIEQLPFFVTACDYCIIGEELYAASAYLSGDPKLVSSIKAQDWGKMGILISLVLGSILGYLGLKFIISWFSSSG